MSPTQEQPDASDIPLNDDDRRRLQDELARIYDTPDSVVLFLNQIGFPVERIPIFRPAERESFWSKIFTELDRGAVAAPYRRMLAVALERHGSYRALADLVGRYGVSAPPQAGDQGDVAAASHPVGATCHVIVRTSRPSERRGAEDWLASQGFGPEQVWSNPEGVSFRLNQADPSVVRERLRQRPDVRWTLIPPGEPDYLINEIIISDRDGRELRIRGLSAQYKLGELADILVRRFPAAHLNVPMLGVISIGLGRRRRRADLSRTLAEEGLSQGSRIEVGTLKSGPLKVFLLGASPKDRDPVYAEKEAKAIKDAARLGHLEFRECQAARARDLPEIRSFQPDILQFSCHSESGLIILEDGEGLSNPVPATTIAKTLRHHVMEGTLRLRGIILASCEGKLIAPAFDGAADTVIAHKDKLDADCARVFTTYFYEELRSTPALDRAARNAALDAASEAADCAMIFDNLIIRGGG